MSAFAVMLLATTFTDVSSCVSLIRCCGSKHWHRAIVVLRPAQLALCVTLFSPLFMSFIISVLSLLLISTVVIDSLWKSVNDDNFLFFFAIICPFFTFLFHQLGYFVYNILYFISYTTRQYANSTTQFDLECTLLLIILKHWSLYQLD